MTRYRVRRGFSLIELMVGLFLSSLVVASIIPVAVNTRNNFRVQSNLSNLMEEGRYLVEIMGKETRRAGYLRNSLKNTADKVFTELNNPFSIASGNLAILNETEYIKGAADATFIDQFIIRYQLHDADELSPNFANSPCTRDLALVAGEDPSVQMHTVTIYFYVSNDANNIPVLYCKARRDNLTAGTSVDSNTARTVISNVEGMRVLYGEDDGVGNISYVSVNQVSDWTQITSIRMSFILQSEDENTASQAVSNVVLNGRYTHDTRNPSEKRLYRVFSVTTALRNQLVDL